MGIRKVSSLEVGPARVYRRVQPLVKVVCKSCEAGSVEATPTGIVNPGLWAWPAILAHVVTAKVADAWPVCRQGGILGRSGFELPRSTLDEYFAASCETVEPISRKLKELTLARTFMSIDDTRLLALGKNKHGGRIHGRMWSTKPARITFSGSELACIGVALQCAVEALEEIEEGTLFPILGELAIAHFVDIRGCDPHSAMNWAAMFVFPECEQACVVYAHERSVECQLFESLRNWLDDLARASEVLIECDSESSIRTITGAVVARASSAEVATADGTWVATAIEWKLDSWAEASLFTHSSQ